MYIYKYSYKSDTTNEVIGSVRAQSYTDAIEKIAQLKQLPVDDVLNLFNVEKD